MRTPGTRYHAVPLVALLENNRAIVVQKHAFLKHESHCFRKNDLFDISAGMGHVRGCIGVVDRYHVLGDNRPGIEVVRDDMSGGANDLDTPLKCLSIGTRAGESR